MKDRDVGGLAVFQDPYAYIAIKQEKGSRNIIMVNNGELIASVPSESDTVYLRAICQTGRKKPFSNTAMTRCFTG